MRLKINQIRIYLDLVIKTLGELYICANEFKPIDIKNIDELNEITIHRLAQEEQQKRWFNQKNGIWDIEKKTDKELDKIGKISRGGGTQPY